MTHGYQENVSIDEGINASGIRTQLHFEGDQLITQRTYDAAPHLQYAADARLATEGKRWGEGRLVGHIPMAEYARFMLIKDNKERQTAIKKWLADNRGFLMFDRYLK